MWQEAKENHHQGSGTPTYTFRFETDIRGLTATSSVEIPAIDLERARRHFIKHAGRSAKVISITSKHNTWSKEIIFLDQRCFSCGEKLTPDDIKWCGVMTSMCKDCTYGYGKTYEIHKLNKRLNIRSLNSSTFKSIHHLLAVQNGVDMQESFVTIVCRDKVVWQGGHCTSCGVKLSTKDAEVQGMCPEQCNQCRGLS